MTTASADIANIFGVHVPSVTSKMAPSASATANPILQLIDGISSIFGALWILLRSFLSFITVTLPHAGFSIIHYSLTLQLNFASLLLLFLFALIGGLLWLRYFKRSYERLKEAPLKTDDGFNLHPELNNESQNSKQGPFHTYLDEFLSAIRIFGFLDKQVFHELARHLQTKRLLAGDSLSLDSDFSFYIVIDGNVQVFAPLPAEAASKEPIFDDEENNGFQLLNEVGSGGTLSSLFTILSLFTEDVHLGTTDSSPPDSNPPTFVHSHEGPSTPLSESGLRRRASAMKPGSEQLQLNAAVLRNVPTVLPAERFEARPPMRRQDNSTLGIDSTLQEDPSQSPLAPGQLQTDPSSIPLEPLPPAQASAPFQNFNARSSTSRQRAAASRSPAATFARWDTMTRKESASASPQLLAHQRSESLGRPHTPGSVLSGYSVPAQRAASIAGIGTSGRPSDVLHHEGVGTVARATVDTTLAVIPAEAFKRLTKRYPSSAANIVQVILTRLSRVTFQTAHRYLGLGKEVMRTEKKMNEVAAFGLPAEFYERGGMERLRQRFGPQLAQQQELHASPVSEAVDTPQTSPDGREIRAAFARDLAPKTPMPRNTIGPGDLISMAGSQEIYRADSSVTSREPQASLRSPQNKSDGKTIRSLSPPLRIGSLESDSGWRERNDLMPDFNLKDEIMDCISKSLGLQTLQAASPALGPSDASPFLHPNDVPLQRSVFNSAFSSLSMLDGMMYEDEASSITGSVSGPQFADLENEVEVRFFPAGSVLAKAGESDAGLFYVIDGFLDVTIPAEKDHVTQETTEKSEEARAAAKKRAEPQRGPAKTIERLSQEARQDGKSGTSQNPQANGQQRPQAGGHLNSAKMGNALDGSSDERIQAQTDLTSASRLLLNGSRRDSPAHSHASRTIRARGGANETAGGSQKSQSRKPIFTVGRGEIAGYLSTLLGFASYVDIRARTDVYVGYLPAQALQRIMERRPLVLLTLSKRLLSLLSPLIIHLDSALDWQHVTAGQVIFREGDEAESFFIVINGRLRAITDRGGTVEVLSEYGQGDSVGEVDVITSSKRRKTLHAIRDSELARMPSTLFNAIATRHPQITIQMSRIIAGRVRDEMERRQVATHSLRSQIPGLPDLGRNNSNLRTVAVVPVTREVPITEFANKLQTAFEDTLGSPAAFLNQSSVMSVLGRHAFNRMGKLKLDGWLSEQEQKFRLVLYVVDTAVSSPWAQTSIRQADSVLLVGFGDDPAVGEYERLLLSVKTTARKELVLLHPERSVPPGSTREWLKSRPWINAHHHIEMPGITRSHAAPMTTDPSAVQALRNLKERLETSLQRYRIKSTGTTVNSSRPPHFSDFARLARRLTGKSIGLILGGGGARGCAHVGVLQALEERGIPIDIVGGTSIGSLIGGLYAKEGEVVSAYGRAKKFCGRMASLWRFASDVTYPLISYTTGHEFNRGIFKALSDTHIEDMWLPFFCNTTNITWSRMEVHTTGYAWRYIRASMTLAGLIPPLVDDGNMLVDGGYMDNLPVSVMMTMGAEKIFAVDVGSIDDTSPRTYGDTLSGWWVLFNRWNPWSDARNIPTLPDIQGRLTYISSVQSLEDAKKMPGCRYLRMPVEGYAVLQFGKFAEICSIGYLAASKMLDEWETKGELPKASVAEHVNGSMRHRKGGVSARRNSV